MHLKLKRMRLLFVYNANSGLLPLLKDVSHKIISPKTYPCSLCALTYNPFTESNTWKTYRKNTTIEMVFYHKDEYESLYNYKTTYPSILIENKNKIKGFIDKNRLNQLTSVQELIALIEKEKNSIL